MATLYSHRESNIRKTWGLMTIFFIVVMIVGWVISWIYDMQVILYIAVVFSVFMNIFSYWNSDKVVLKLSGAKPVTREQFPDLWNITENLSITAGLPMPKIYIMDENVPNAFATGRNPENSAIAVTTGLLNILDKSELEGVVAHELSHVGNRDTLLQTVVVILVGFVSLLSDFFLRISLYGGRSSNSDSKAGGVFAIAGVILVLLAPIVATLMRLAISRKREFLADASGALLTRYPEGLARALEKISSHGGRMKHAHNATAHLFISNPFGKKGKALGVVSRLFMTHPPVGDRVSALRGGV